MRIYFIIILSLLFACKKENTIINLSIQNPSNWNRFDEPITLVLSDYFRGDLHLKNNLKLYENGQIIPCQFIDSPNHGKMNKLFFTSSFNKKETKSYKLIYHKLQNHNTISDSLNLEAQKIIINKNDSIKHTVQAFISNDIIWNNIIFETGIDIINNTTESRNTSNLNNKNTYQPATTMESGSLAIKFNNTIFKVKTPTKSNYQFISNGVFKTVFQLNHFNWIQDDRNFNIDHNISIDKTAHYYDRIVECTGVQEGDELIIGMDNELESLIIITDNPAYVIIATANNTSINADLTDAGIIIAKKDFVKIYDNNAQKNSIKASSLIGLKLFNNRPIKFRYYQYNKKHNAHYDDFEQFLKKMKTDALNLSQPILIELLK